MNAMLSKDPLETEPVTCGVAGASLLSQTLTFPVDKLSQTQLLAQVRVFEPECLLHDVALSVAHNHNKLYCHLSFFGTVHM